MILFWSIVEIDDRHGSRRNSGALLFASDVGAHFRRESLGVEDDAVFDDNLHAADALRLVRLRIEADVAGRVKHFQIGEGILADNDEIGALADLDGADFILGAEDFRAVERRRLDDFEQDRATAEKLRASLRLRPR